MKLLLTCWLLLAVLSGVAAGVAPQVDLRPTVAAMRTNGVSVTVVWETCGVPNAAYVIGTKTIIMCHELLLLPEGVARAAFAHEYAHAIIRQLDLPYTGSEEAAADELAAVKLIAAGQTADVIAVARFWALLNQPEDPTDDHPSSARRFFTMGCLAVGSERPESACGETYTRARAAWGRLLALPR